MTGGTQNLLRFQLNKNKQGILKVLSSKFFCVGFVLMTSGTSLAEVPVSRIIHGNEATSEQWPFMSAIYRRGSFFCGASAIADAWTLTAGHCVLDRDKTIIEPSELKIERGTAKLGTKLKQSVEKVCIYPYFDHNTFNNDIALIQHQANKTDHVRLALRSERPSNGSAVTVAGFGRTETLRVSSALRETRLSAVESNTCSSSFSGGKITANMWCATTPSGHIPTDSCQGDSGGPIVAYDENGDAIQVGLVSWGIGCADPQHPGVYTQLDRYKVWIDACMRGDDSICNTCTGSWDHDGDETCDAEEDIDGDGKCSVSDSMTQASVARFASSCSERATLSEPGIDSNDDGMLSVAEIEESIEKCTPSSGCSAVHPSDLGVLVGLCAMFLLRRRCV